MDSRPDDETVKPAETPAPEAASAAPEAEAPSPAEAGGAASETDGSAAAEGAAVMQAAVAELPKSGGPPEPRKGGPIRGKIVKLGEEGAFVDFGGREEAFLDRKEITDAEGKLTHDVGADVRGTVLSVEGGVKMSLKAAGGKPGAHAGNIPALLDAAKTGAPVEGKVTGVNKGGLVVQILGVRAFCPFSQIDRHWVEDPSVFVGQKLAFRVSSADPKGRNVVLSRRVLLEQDSKEKAEDLRKDLAVGKVLKGTVVRLRPFGAFVDLGGIDGLIHVSEISHRRIKDPSEVLKVGQEVEVKIRSVDNLGRPDERIGLSMKELQGDPWTTAAGALKPGEKVRVKVVRLAEFGAFMEVAPGIDGLAHVSTLADHRVGHPSEVLEVGQELEVWIVSVDPGTKRISLSVVDPATRGARGDRGPRDEEGGGGGWSGGGDMAWGAPDSGKEGGRGRRDRDRGGRGGRDRGRDGGRRDGGRRDGGSGGRRDQSWREDYDRGYRGGGDGGMTSMQEAFERMRERN